MGAGVGAGEGTRDGALVAVGALRVAMGVAVGWDAAVGLAVGRAVAAGIAVGSSPTWAGGVVPGVRLQPDNAKIITSHMARC